MAKWAKEGKMKWHETIYEGIERAPEAFIELFKGENFGKMLCSASAGQGGLASIVFSTECRIALPLRRYSCARLVPLGVLRPLRNFGEGR